MSEITPYDDDELSVNGLRQRIREQRERIRELEAQAAAMRAEIIRRVEEDGPCADHHRDDCPEEHGCEDCQEADRINAVLAPDAGKALLEELTQLRAEKVKADWAGLHLRYDDCVAHDRQTAERVLEEVERAVCEHLLKHPVGTRDELLGVIRALAQRDGGA